MELKIIPHLLAQAYNDILWKKSQTIIQVSFILLSAVPVRREGLADVNESRLANEVYVSTSLFFGFLFTTFRFSSTQDTWSTEMNFAIIRLVYGFRICSLHMYLQAYKVLYCLIDTCHRPTYLTPLAHSLQQRPNKNAGSIMSV